MKRELDIDEIKEVLDSLEFKKLCMNDERIAEWLKKRFEKMSERRKDVGPVRY
jgi:hypothetical protein